MDESCTGRWCFLKPLLEGVNPLYFEITIYIILFIIFVVIFGSITYKDTVRNIIETGEFVHNFVTWDVRDAMNLSSATTAKDVDELAAAQLTQIPSKLVKAPRVAESPIHFECKLIQHVDLPNTIGDSKYTVIFGEVIGVHIADDLITGEGLIDIGKLHPVARMGYQDYTEVTAETVFTLERPGFRSKEDMFTSSPPEAGD